jgi:replicative DNA helicase
MYLFTNNLSIDIISIINLIQHSKHKGELDKFGGEDYIYTLEQAPVTDNIPMFCRQIINEYIKRQTYDTCEEILNSILENKINNPLEVMNTKTMELTLENTKKNKTYKMGDKLQERLDKRQDAGKLAGLSTGWKKFDNITGGASGGDLVVVCAESKVGKSVALMNWAENIAVQQQLPILWIDTEQSDEEEEYRLLAITSQVPEEELKRGLYKVDTFYGTAVDKQQRIDRALALIKSAKFFHVYMPDFTTEKVIAKTREYYLKEGIVAVFFDYIHLTDTLLSTYRGMRDDIILTTFTNTLKTIGGELGIPVFTAVQENRSGYNNTEKDAKNIGGSIGILQKATQLLFLRNMTDEELALTPNANQKFIVKYLRHGECPQEINIMYSRPFITMREA